MNRSFIRLAAGLMVATLVAQGCTGGATPSAGPVTLTLWHNYGTEANAAVTENLVKAYEASHPNVSIEIVSQPADNYFALLKAAAIAKTGPDLLTMWTGLFALQNQSFLEPLNQYIPVDQLKTFPGIDWCSKDLSVEKGAICVPLDNQSYNGFYNKDLFAKAGVTKVPTTWAELTDASAKLKAAGIQPFAYGTGGQALNAGFYPYYDLSYMMMIFPVTDWKKLYNGEIPWTDPAIVAQLTKWADLKKNGYTNEDVLTNTESIAQFEAGKAAMTLEGSWDFKEFQDKMGDTVGIFLPPFVDEPLKGVVEFPGNGYGVTSYSQHKADAAEFLKFMLTPEAQKIIADGGLIPTIAGTPPSQRMATDLLDYGANQGFQRYPMIDNVMQPEVVDVATRVLNAVLAGTMSPQDAAQKMQDALMQLPPERRGDTDQ